MSTPSSPKAGIGPPQETGSTTPDEVSFLGCSSSSQNHPLPRKQPWRGAAAAWPQALESQVESSGGPAPAAARLLLVTLGKGAAQPAAAAAAAGGARVLEALPGWGQPIALPPKWGRRLSALAAAGELKKQMTEPVLTVWLDTPYGLAAAALSARSLLLPGGAAVPVTAAALKGEASSAVPEAGPAGGGGSMHSGEGSSEPAVQLWARLEASPMTRAPAEAQQADAEEEEGAGSGGGGGSGGDKVEGH